MILKKAVIDGFGRYGDATFSFDRGLNMVYGENEAGKTTLLWFLRGMLFGLKGGRTTADLEKPPLRKYEPDQGAYGGSLSITTDENKDYIIVRDFADKRLSIFDEHYNDVTEKLLRKKNMQPGEVFLQLGEDFFAHTAWFSEKGVELDPESRRQVEDKLADVSQTGFFDRSLAQALDVLTAYDREKIGSVNDRRSAANRPLPKVTHSIATYEREIQKYEQIDQNIEKVRENQKKIRDELDKVESTLKKVENEQKAWHTLEELLDNMEQKLFLERHSLAIQTYNRKIETKIEKRQALEREKKPYASFESVHESDIKHLVQLGQAIRFYETEWAEAKKEREAYQKEYEEIQQRLDAYAAFIENPHRIDDVLDLRRLMPSMKKQSEQSNRQAYERRINQLLMRQRLFMWTLVVCGLLFIAGSTAAFLWIDPIVAGGSFLITVGLVCGGVFWLKKITRSIRHIKSDYQQGKQVRTPQAIEYQKAKALFVEIMDMFDCESFEQFRKKLAEYKKMEQDKATFAEGLRFRTKLEQQKHSALMQTKRQSQQAMAGMEEDTGEDEISAILRIEQKWEQYQKIIDAFEELLPKIEADQRARQSHEEALAERGYSNREQAGVQIEKLQKAVKMVLQEQSEALIEATRQNWIKDLSSTAYADLPSHKQNVTKNARECQIRKERVLEEKRALQSDLHTLDLERRTLEDDKENKVKDMEALTRLQRARKDMLLQKQIVEQTREALQAAGERVKRKFYKPLSQKMRHAVRAMTSSAYEDLKVGDRLLVRAKDPAANVIRNAKDLSEGTVAQIYLALRIAALELMEDPNIRCPLFADEIFSSYDDQRFTQALLYIHEKSKERQVFIFSCRAREPQTAEKILDKVHVIRL